MSAKKEENREKTGGGVRGQIGRGRREGKEGGGEWTNKGDQFIFHDHRLKLTYNMLIK